MPLDAASLGQFLNDPDNMAAIGMLGSTQTPGPAYMAAQQQAAAQRQAALQQQMGQMAYQQAQARQNFNPQQYLVQPGQTPPQGAIGNVDMSGLLKGAAQAGMGPEEAQQYAQVIDPWTAMRMKLLSQPAVAVAPGGQLVSPGLAQLGGGGMGGVPAAGGQAPGVLANNTNPPPDSPLAQLMMLKNARAQVPDGSPSASQLDTLIAKTTGSLEYGNDQDQMATATAIAHGKLAPLTGNAMRSPQSQKIMSMVTQINPDYNGHDWAMNDEAYKAFATGAQGNQVRSLNVGISHAQTLGQLAMALGNGNTKAINEAKQQWQEQTGNTAPTNFDSAKEIVGTELTKAIMGGGSAGASNDRDQMKAALDRANSPQQLAGVVNTYTTLLGGQLNGLQKQYEATTGRNDFRDRFLQNSTRNATGTQGNGTYDLNDVQAELQRRGLMK